MTTTPINTTRQMKQKNIMLVANTLKLLISATKGDISAQTGLSLATCGTILNELCAKGEIIEESLDESRGGRPAKRYIYNQNYFTVLSVFLVGSDTNGIISSALTSAAGNIIEEVDENYSNLTVDTIINHVGRLVKKYNNIKAIGIGLPGVIVDGKVLTCDITCLESLPITDILSEKFGVFIQVGNDINYTAFGFYRHECRDENNPIAYIFMPEKHCAGCGIVISGKMLRGASQFAGEVSKLPFYDNLHKTDNINNYDEDVFEKLVNIASSLIAIINPATIAISSELLSKTCIEDLIIELQKKFNNEHIPHFVFRDSIKADYHNGISEYTLDTFNHFRIFESQP